MITKQMKQLIEARKKVETQDDEGTKEYWDKEIEVLEQSLDWTIDYLKNASEDEIYWSTEIWDDISEYFCSKKLIDTFKYCEKKCHVDKERLRISVYYAEEMTKLGISEKMKQLANDLKSIDDKNINQINDIESKQFELLSQSLDWTMEYLNNASEEEILYGSKIWNKLNSFYKSNELVNVMEECTKKYPNIYEKIKGNIPKLGDNNG